MSTLGLYEDGRFPGRCLLAFNVHVEHFDELSRSSSHQLTDDLRRCAAVIRRVTGASRVNLAILGNVQPHLHVHLIPRGGKADPVPGQSPWSDPGGEIPLPVGEADEWIQAISRALEE